MVNNRQPLRVPQNIRNIVNQAINLYRHYQDAERRAFLIIRYIANRVYTNQGDAEAFIQYVQENYNQNMNALGLAAGTFTARQIRNIANNLAQIATEAREAIVPHAQNFYEQYLMQPYTSIANALGFRTLRQFYNEWQQLNNDQSFYEYMQNYMGRHYDRQIERAIRSFLNSQGTAQAPIEVELNNQGNMRIVPREPHLQAVPHTNNAVVDRTGGANQLAAGFAQGFNAPTQSLSTTTEAPTTTTASPTTTTAAPQTGTEMVLRSAIGGGAPTAGGQHGETGVDMVNYTKFHPFKRTEQVLMPFYKRSTISLPANNTSAVPITFRLNSIYDIVHAAATYSEIDPNISPPTADTPDAVGIREVPMMREYWKQFYNYWHVVKCEWKFSYLPLTQAQSNLVQKQLFIYEHGIQFPPLTQQIAGGSPPTLARIPWWVRKYHPHVRQRTIRNPDADSQRCNNWQTITGVWHPGDIQHEVAEDELTRVWHKFEQVPPTAEKLTIMLDNMDSMPNDGNAWTLEYNMEMTYTVQLKDLKTQYEFITEVTGIPAVSQFIQRSV